MQEEEQEKEEECEDLVPYGNLMIRNVVDGNEENEKWKREKDSAVPGAQNRGNKIDSGSDVCPFV